MANLSLAADALRVMARVIGLSIAEVTNTYRDQLTNFSYGAMNGRMDALDLARAMRALLRDLADEVYIEGLREGGIDDPESALDEDDEQAIKDWLSGQLPYIRDFASAVVSVRQGDISRSEVLSRIDLWVDNLDLLGKRGYASAKQNVMGTWQYGDTDHCDTCRMLNGKRRRMKWFTRNGYYPQERGSTTLDCHGFACQCRVVDDDGIQLMP